MPFRFNPFTKKLDEVSVGGGGTGILSITGNSGGAVGPDGSNNINVIGAGAISISGDPLSNTLTVSSSFPFLSWTVIAGNTMATTQNGYFTNGVGRVDIALPLSSSVGDLFIVADLGGNKWRVTQNSGQQIILGTSATTAGATGYIESIFRGDSATLVCCVANLTWMVLPPTGNITIV